MHQRCNNPRTKSYALYGARGIKVCERWWKFDNFLEDMGKRPGGKREYSLERIDHDGDYEPRNCRWASAQEQALNRRDNRLITIKGITKPLTVWAREAGLKPVTVFGRYRRGWGLDRLFTPPKKG